MTAQTGRPSTARILGAALAMTLMAGCVAPTPSIAPSHPTHALVPNDVPESASVLIQSTVIAFEDPATGLVRVGTLGSEAFDTGLRGVARVDWNWPVVTALDANGDTAVTIIDPPTHTAEVRAVMDDPQETVLATVDPSGEAVYVYGLSMGLIRVIDGDRQHFDTPLLPADPVGLGPMLWSPDGAVLATSSCSMETCLVNVFDVVTETMTTVANVVPLGVSGSWLVGYARDQDRSWIAIDLADGSRTPIRTTATAAVDAQMVSASRVILSSTDGPIVEVLDLGTGDSISAARPEPGALLGHLWVDDEWAAIATATHWTATDAARVGGTYWTLMNLRTGELLPRTIPIGFLVAAD